MSSLDEQQQIDVPVEIDAEQAARMADDLEAGETVTLEIDSDTAPELAEDIRWQLETGERALVYSSAFKEANDD